MTMTGFQCNCATGYTGTTCELCDVGYHTANGQPVSPTNECTIDTYGANNQFIKCTKTNPCLQGGTCSDDVDNGPQCACTTGYTGATCELCDTGYHTANGQPVSATNECTIDTYPAPTHQFIKCTKTNPCLQGGQCADDPINGPQCTCAPGYTGATCENCDTGYHTVNGQPVSATNECTIDTYPPWSQDKGGMRDNRVGGPQEGQANFDNARISKALGPATPPFVIFGKKSALYVRGANERPCQQMMPVNNRCGIKADQQGSKMFPRVNEMHIKQLVKVFQRAVGGNVEHLAKDAAVSHQASICSR